MIDDKRDEDDDGDLDNEEDEDEDGEDEEDFEDEEDYVPRIEPERAKAYTKTLIQLQTFYREISLISNKKPDSPLNEFKLGLINETLEKANVVLGDEFRPFPGFNTFDNANMPSASDVVLMISHYVDGLHAFEAKYCERGRWYTTEDEELDEDSDDD